jgi:hypothetical protein
VSINSSSLGESMASAWLLACAALLLVVQSSSAQVATARAQSVAVLRATDSSASVELAGLVDGALARDLSGIAGIERPTVSPVDFADIQMTVGCTDESDSCLGSIARTAQVEAILVRELSVDSGGTISLRLLYFDTRQGASTSAQLVVATSEKSRLDTELPKLVRKVFGLADPVESRHAAASQTDPPLTQSAQREPSLRSNPPPPDAHAQADRALSSSTSAADGGISALTWVTLGTGAATLAAGVIVGALSQSDFDDFKSSRVVTRQDADRANAAFDTAHTKAVVANVLMPVGGALLALGATLLVIDLSSHADHEPPTPKARLQVTPLVGGGMLTLHTSFESGAR